MKFGIVYTIIMILAVSISTETRAAEGEKKRPVGGLIGEILKNAEALGLTAEQKTKLEEMAKGPLGVLTDEQKTKARELIKIGRPDGKPKKNTEEAQKPEEKKTEAAKTEEKKPEVKVEEKPEVK